MTDVLPRSMLLPEDPRRRGLHLGGDETPIPIEFFRRFSEAIRTNHIQVANRIEELINYGDFAARPDATGSGKFYYANDTSALYFDDGAWDEITVDLSGYLPLTAGSGYPLTGDLYIENANSPAVYFREGGSATEHTILWDGGNGYFYFQKTAPTAAYIDISAVPTDETSDAKVRLFRSTNTSGTVSLEILQGDGTATVQHNIDAGTGDVSLCQQAGEFSVLGEGIANVISDAGGGPAYLRLRARENAERYAEINNYLGTLEIRQYNTNTDGSAYIKIDPMPDGAGDAGIYIFNETTTTGAAFIDIKVGDGSATSQHTIEADTGDVSLCQQAGKLVVGGPVQLPYLGAAPSGLTNGMIWMESDGLHIYYAGAEKTVAGV
jgi:hypothetical protein